MTGAESAFAAFGLTTQALLLAFFAARRWTPELAGRYGWVVYAVAALGLPLGAWLLLGGQSPRLVIGPLLMGLWAVLGAVVDLWRRRDWRGPPVVWRVLIPYVAVYFTAQMFLWWPLWNIGPIAWAGFLVLFVPSTILNLRGHAAAEFDTGEHTPVLRVIGRVARGIVNLLPDAPSYDAPPPDIDGRRPSEIDPEALRHLERTRKDGRGGNR